MKRSNKEITSNQTQNSFIQSPFPHLIIQQFLNEKSYENILNATKKLSSKLVDKSNDLYEFKQYFEELTEKEFILELKTNLKDLAKNNLYPEQTFLKKENYEISAFYAEYKNGNYLLAHDDQMEDRMFAWILYLVDEDWSESDGGHLHLYEILV